MLRDKWLTDGYLWIGVPFFERLKSYRDSTVSSTGERLNGKQLTLQSEELSELVHCANSPITGLLNTHDFYYP